MKIEDSDLEEVLFQLRDDLSHFQNARIFITGGTGYLGKWLLEFFHYFKRQSGSTLEVVVLSRNIARFLEQYPYFGREKWCSFWEGDVRSFPFPKGDFTHIIHAATDVVATISALETFDVTVLGTRRILEFARERTVRDILLVSSGAVYGVFPGGVERISESCLGQLNVSSTRSAYGLGKQAAEWLGNCYSEQYALGCKTARMFAQVGPYLDLEARFAIGNFISDVLKNQKLTIQGDGTAVRSYMYGTDLVVWLLRILTRGKPTSVYNVGSEEGISIRSLADLVLDISAMPSSHVEVLGKVVSGAAPNHYLPDTTLARSELDLSINVPLREAIQRTITWHKRK